MKGFVTVLCILSMLYVQAQLVYTTDVLGGDFRQATIQQADDYEGKVTCTVVRKLCTKPTSNAVLYIHGFNDYFFQSEMAQWYNDNGFHFYAVDLRKYGRSILPHQKMNNVRDLREYYADIDTALRIIHAEGSTNVLLSGHSTGGLITTLYAQEHPDSKDFNALFLNSPFFDFNEPWLLQKLGVPVLAKKGRKHPDKLKEGGFTQWYGHSLHRSEKGEWEYNLAWKPHVAPAVNYGWINAIYSAQQDVATGKAITVPVLVICSERSVYTKQWDESLLHGDAILDVKDIKAGAKRLNTTSNTIVAILGVQHDVVLSPKPERAMVYEELKSWMDAINTVQLH